MGSSQDDSDSSSSSSSGEDNEARIRGKKKPQKKVSVPIADIMKRVNHRIRRYPTYSANVSNVITKLLNGIAITTPAAYVAEALRILDKEVTAALHH